MIAALVVGVVGLAGLACGLAFLGGGEDAAPQGAGGARASALAEDACFTGFRQEGAKIFARAVPCTSAHEGEVHAKPDLPILDYPGDARLVAEGAKACRVQASSLYAAGRDDEFTLVVGRPGKKEWESGERAVTCLLRYAGGPKNFRLEGQWTPLNLLAEGDCVGTWKGTGDVDVVDCTKEHEVQVLAKLALTGAQDPDEADVYALCAQRARRVFGTDPPAHLLLRLGGPNGREWA
ncbi:septum formation family protein, partial [Actinomadura darangshiensis]|uniref:septum formation family protein n=1 Tax=Actinomadura darangshiensis TaxID=705336 RepID=UPI001A9DE1A0